MEIDAAWSRRLCEYLYTKELSPVALLGHPADLFDCVQKVPRVPAPPRGGQFLRPRGPFLASGYMEERSLLKRG